MTAREPIAAPIGRPCDSVCAGLAKAVCADLLRHESRTVARVMERLRVGGPVDWHDNALRDLTEPEALRVCGLADALRYEPAATIDAVLAALSNGSPMDLDLIFAGEWREGDLFNSDNEVMR